MLHDIASVEDVTTAGLVRQHLSGQDILYLGEGH